MGQFTHGVRAERNGAANSKWAAEDSAMADRWPALYEYLCERLDDGGNERTTSTVLLFAEDGVFKLCLTDRSARTGEFEYSIWVSASTLLDGLAVLDEALRDPHAPWRKRPKYERPKKR